ncbi:gremlin-2-like [Gigantopelta aegis]|uniref:gremlin-2-like n=1 Tax=Gigantopelta aegis TaxID=1735272 RepID=UPI001B88758D|nr:gremlin-2-like [Gigantopelta aegis]
MRIPWRSIGHWVLVLLVLVALIPALTDGRRRHHHRNRHGNVPKLQLNSTSSSSSSSAAKSGKSVLQNFGGRRHRSVIRGSRNAVVITKKTYLRKEWCKTQPLKQVIKEKGCLRTTVLNNFCYGQCNSFFIPKSDKKDDRPAAFMSCGFCKPRHFRWILVTLKCPGKKGMRFKRKRVQGIKKCRCMAQNVGYP